MKKPWCKILTSICINDPKDVKAIVGLRSFVYFDLGTERKRKRGREGRHKYVVGKIAVSVVVVYVCTV